MPTRRQEKVNARLVVEISQAIRDLKDPRIGFVTITGAEVTPDLTEARILFSVLGDERAAENSAAALQHAAGFLRRRIADNLGLRTTPHLRFAYDRNIAYADEISRLIFRARASDRDGGSTSPGTGGTPEGMTDEEDGGSRGATNR